MNRYVIKKESGSVDSSEGLPITYDLYSPTSVSYALPIVIFIHGFKGFKDWGPFPDACIEIAEKGYAVLSVNLSLNGIGKNPTVFDRLDLFARETLTQDQRDIKTVLDAICLGTITSGHADLDTTRIGLIGHSRGGHSAIVAAANYEEVNCLVTWAALSSFEGLWNEQMINDWKTKGYTEILNSRTGQKMRIDKVVYDDATKNTDSLMASKRVKELRIPVCFIHGKEDENVPYKHAEILFENCPSSEKKRVIIPKTGHTFGGRHPFEEDDLPEPFVNLMDATINWLDANL